MQSPFKEKWAINAMTHHLRCLRYGFYTKAKRLAHALFFCHRCLVSFCLLCFLTFQVWELRNDYSVKMRVTAFAQLQWLSRQINKAVRRKREKLETNPEHSQWQEQYTEINLGIIFIALSSILTWDEITVIFFSFSREIQWFVWLHCWLYSLITLGTMQFAKT